MSGSVKITIKPYYRSETLNYFVGIVENLGLYVIQATDNQGFIMGIPGQTSKENPSTAVFGISKEEFDLKDSDREKLDDLAFRLMHELPADRIIAEHNLRKGGRVQSIDDGKYASEKTKELETKKNELITASTERAKKLIGEMVEKGEGWFLYTKGAGNRLPTIDSSGAVQIFTKEEYAKEVAEKAPDVPLEIQKMDKNGINLFFQNLFRYGILRVKVDLLQSTGGEALRDEAVKLGGIKEYGLLNSKCFSLMIRYLQAKQIKDSRIAQASSATLWNALCKDFAKGLYFVPMCFEGEEGQEISEKEIYFTQSSAKICKETKPVILGIEKYKPSSGDGRLMKFLTLKSNSGEDTKIVFPVFTDIEELKAVFGDKARLCIISYDDLREKYVSCFGVVVNPASLNLIITVAGMENIEKEKDTPYKVFKLEESENKAEQ